MGDAKDAIRLKIEQGFGSFNGRYLRVKINDLWMNIDYDEVARAVRRNVDTMISRDRRLLGFMDVLEEEMRQNAKNLFLEHTTRIFRTAMSEALDELLKEEKF